MSKKKWLTPTLIVVVRGKPEEKVLSLCKSYSWGNYSHTRETGCNWRLESSCVYTDCSMKGDS